MIKHVKFTELLLKIMCFQKTLNQTDHCISTKINCFVAELNNNNDETKNKNNSFNI